MSRSSINPFGDLSIENHEQIRRYIRFFRQKKDGILRQISNEFADAKSDKLNEDMFTRDDMEEFSDFLTSAVRNQVSSEVGSLINMSALAVSQLLESAQEKGVELNLETSAVENQVLVDAVDKMSLDTVPKNARRGVGQLTSFRDEAKAMKEQTGHLEETNKRLRDEVEALNRRLATMERQLLDERSRSNSKPAAAPVVSESKMSSDDGAASADRIRRLEEDLKESREENNKRVSETSQFQQMRQMMQTQASKIRDLRRRLDRYEPDSLKEEDD